MVYLASSKKFSVLTLVSCAELCSQEVDTYIDSNSMSRGVFVLMSYVLMGPSCDVNLS